MTTDGPLSANTPGDTAAPILSYRVEPRARSVAKRLWWAMLLLALALLGAFVLLFNPLLETHEHLGYGIIATPAAPIDFDSGSDFRFSPFKDTNLVYALHAGLYFALFLLTQWLFLMPRGAWRLRLDTEGSPLKRTAIAGGFVAMLLSAGILALLLDFPFAVGKETSDFSAVTPWLYLTLAPAPGGDFYQAFGVFLLVMLVMWIGWAWLFWRYSRSLDRHTALTRIFRGLVAGTVLETLAAAPAHAYLASKDECYCTRGSYTALVFGATALFWLFGPGIFLLCLREKRKLERAVNDEQPNPVPPPAA